MVLTETIWPTQPEISPIRPFTEKLAHPWRDGAQAKHYSIDFKALRVFWYICRNVFFIGLVICLQTLLAFLAESDHLSPWVSSSMTNPDHRGTVVMLRLRTALLWCVHAPVESECSNSH